MESPQKHFYIMLKDDGCLQEKHLCGGLHCILS